ncbi:MAG: hypothetical protein RI894_939 [Bacteroidota bacterium]|jgi:hypothetical protein
MFRIFAFLNPCNQMEKADFFRFKSHQYCDNPACSSCHIVDGGNLTTHSIIQGQVRCTVCKGKPFSVRKGTMFFDLRTPMAKIVRCLTYLASGTGMNAVCRNEGVDGQSLRSWIVLASEQVTAFTTYMQQDMALGEVQIDEFWSYIKKKKENLTAEEKAAALVDTEVAENQGDRWCFVGVCPDSSFIQTVHNGKRTQDEATEFIGKIKAKSNGKPPLFSSDDWFYEKAFLAHYGVIYQPPYRGRGPHPATYLVPMANLRYVQVTKKRDAKGNIVEVGNKIVYGSREAIEAHFDAAKRSKHINTDYVESRNGKFRLCCARLIRKTLCCSKKAIFHDAMILFTAQVFNYCQPVAALKQCINPLAARFERKYRQISAAMAEGLIDNILTINDLLCIRPLPV